MHDFLDPQTAIVDVAMDAQPLALPLSIADSQVLLSEMPGALSPSPCPSPVRRKRMGRAAELLIGAVVAGSVCAAVLQCAAPELIVQVPR
jgi:hypothetical protein